MRVAGSEASSRTRGRRCSRIIAAAVLVTAVLAAGAGCARLRPAVPGGEGEAADADRIRQLEDEVRRLEAELEAARADDARGESPGAGDAGSWRPAAGFRPERVEDLPAEVARWLAHYDETAAGVARTFGDRTYIAVSYVQPGEPQHRVTIREVLVSGPGSEPALMVIADLAHVSDPERVGPLSVASIDAVAGSLERDPARLRFRLVDDALPRVFNAHGLPDVDLPAEGNVALVRPAPGEAVPTTFRVAGYARHLFEANLVARAVATDGKLLAEQATTAAACCFDWGSFELEITVPLPADSVFTLELGDYSMNTGTWQAWLRLPLRVAR